MNTRIYKEKSRIIKAKSMIPPTFTSNSEDQTADLAQEFAKILGCGDVLCLNGEMGAGKTAFSRALIRSYLGYEAEVPSPTFTLVQLYEKNETAIWHFDLYRLNDPEEVFELGWEEALSSGITIVEWPARLGSLMPVSRYDISISIVNNDVRVFKIDKVCDHA